MNIKIKKDNRLGYSFSVFEEIGDVQGMEYSSDRDHYLVAGVRPFYPTYPHAHSVALKVAEQYPEIVRAKKVAFSKSSLSKQSNFVEDFFDFWKTASQNSFGLRLYEESCKNVESFSNISFQNKKIKHIASEEQSGKDRLLNILRFYAEKAAIALSPVHKNARISMVEYLPNLNSYDVVLSDESGELCCVKFDDRMLLDDIIPYGRIVKEAPLHSKTFFEKYFEPIMDAIGHIVLPNDIVAVVHHPSSKRRKMAAFSISDKSSKWVRLSLPDSEDVSWKFTVEPLTSLMSSFKNVNVKCIRSDLPTYYGKTGLAIDEINRGTYKDVVVDFKRGLGLVVMTDSDIEPISD